MSRRSRAHERRSLLVLALAALTFVTVQQVGGWLLRNRWPEVRFAGLEDLERHARDARHRPVVAFLGSSRFGCGIKPTEISRSWQSSSVWSLGEPLKFALPACDSIAMEFIYANLRRQGLTPSVVVLEISPETLADRCFWLNYHTTRQMGWHELFQLAGELRDRQLLRPLAIGQSLPLWKYRSAMRHELLRLALPELPPRHPSVLEGDESKVAELMRILDRRRALPYEDRVEEGLAPLRTWFLAREYRVGGANLAALERLMTRLRRENVQTVLVDVPVCKAQRALYSPTVESQYQAALSLMRARHADLVHIEARALCADSLFSDNHHLTNEGGSRFSQFLADELQSRLHAELAQKR